MVGKVQSSHLGKNWFYISGNKSRGQADGFGLDILPKLKDVKSKVSRFQVK